MGKRLLALILVAAVLVPVVISAIRYDHDSTTSAVQVLFVRGTTTSNIAGPVAKAWSEAAGEVGVSYSWINATSLIEANPISAATSDPVIVFPDAVAQGLPDAVLGWSESYVAHGGHLLVDDDAGTFDQSGSVRPSDLFDSLLGISYSNTGKAHDPDIEGKIAFASAAVAAQWNVPTGKLTSADVLSGYSYGALTYSLADARQDASRIDVVARSGDVPAITTRRYGAGVAVWTAMALGELSAYGTDATPIDVVLQTVAVNLAGVPRILLAPDGGGGLVIDWHVESNADWVAIPKMQQLGLLRPGIDQEFDISAGKNERVAGGGFGFDACGKGRSTLLLLVHSKESIGSDAGGVADLFAKQLEKGVLTASQIRQLVAANASCVTSVTGERMESYVGPDGVFPQPEMTKIIQKLGFDAYYYTGDSGAAPQLVFWDGKLTSSSLWAFPVAPNGSLAALSDMAAAHVPASSVEVWLKSVASYAADEGTIQLIYSHPPDLFSAPGYATAYSSFLNYVAELQHKDQLVTESMGSYAKFLSRRADAHMSLRSVKGGVQVTITDKAGLRDIAIATPTSWKLVPAAGVAKHSNVESESSYVVRTDTRRVVLRFTFS